MNRPNLLITGLSSGVGLSLARHLADRYRVIGLVRKLEETRRMFEDIPDLVLYGADLSNPTALTACLDRIVEEHGTPLRLINNAGVNHPARIEQLTPRDLSASLQVNCLAPLAIMQRLLPGMVAAGYGRIINITSGAPLNCFAGFAAYSASKAALNAVTVTAAREYADRDIRINLMSPGPVRSNMAPEAPMDPNVCHPTADYLLELPTNGPTGRFFWLGREIPLFPDLGGIQWLEGRAPERFRRVL